MFNYYHSLDENTSVWSPERAGMKLAKKIIIYGHLGGGP